MEPMRFRKITDPEDYYKFLDEENRRLKNENRDLQEKNRNLNDSLENRRKLIEIKEKKYRDLLDKYESVLSELEAYELQAEESNDYQEDFREVALYWGRMMPMMAMEEAGEFIQAISKYERYLSDEDDLYDHQKGKELINNITKEMADMIISIGALMYKYNINDDRVEKALEEKLSKEY